MDPEEFLKCSQEGVINPEHIESSSSNMDRPSSSPTTYSGLPTIVVSEWWRINVDNSYGSGFSSELFIKSRALSGTNLSVEQFHKYCSLYWTYCDHR